MPPQPVQIEHANGLSTAYCHLSRFAPGLHVNYAETVLPIRDGLPKLKDFPKEFGGSGEAIPE